MSMFNSEAKLFGLDLRDLAGQLRDAWQGLGQLPWLRRCMPASRLRIVGVELAQPAQAWVRGSRRWTWSSAPGPAQADVPQADGAPAYTGLLLGSDQQLLRSLRLPRMPQAAVHSAVALDVQTMSPFPEQETLWAYRIHSPGPREPAATGLHLDLCITSRALVRQALQQCAGDLRGSEQVEIWGGARQSPIMLPGFGEELRLGREARQRRWLGLAAGAMLALALALALTPTAQLRLRAIDAGTKFQALLQQTAPVAAQRQGMTAGAQEVAQLQEKLHGQVDHLRVLATLAQVYPDDTAVQRIQFKGRQITVQGLSDNASNVVQLMARTPGFTEVRMPSAVTRVPGMNKENFVVEAQIDVDALGVLAQSQPQAAVAPAAIAAQESTR